MKKFYKPKPRNNSNPYVTKSMLSSIKLMPTYSDYKPNSPMPESSSPNKERTLKKLKDSLKLTKV